MRPGAVADWALMLEMRTGLDSHVMRSIAVALVLALGLGEISNAQAASGDPRTQMLRDELARPIPPDGVRISVVLREPDARLSRTHRRDRIHQRQAAVFSRIHRGRFDLGRRYSNISGFSGWADAEAIEILMQDPDVVAIDVDRVAYATLTQGVSLVGATTTHGLGVTGSGVTVAVLDTGIDTDHPDLSSSLDSEICFCDDAPGMNGCCPGGGDTETGPGSAEDDEGHGTRPAQPPPPRLRSGWWSRRVCLCEDPAPGAC
jgi:hypothetical protein